MTNELLHKKIDQKTEGNHYVIRTTDNCQETLLLNLLPPINKGCPLK